MNPEEDKVNPGEDETLIHNNVISLNGNRPGPKPKPRVGRRPGAIKKNIRWSVQILNLIEKYSEAQCTDEEIATMIGTTRETFNRKKNKKGPVKDAYDKGKAMGRSNVRLQIYAKAKKGDIRALELAAKSWFYNDEGWEGMHSKSSPAIVNNNTIVNQEPSEELKKIAELMAGQIGPTKIIEASPEQIEPVKLLEASTTPELVPDTEI